MTTQHRRAGERMTPDDVENELRELYERLSPAGELCGTEEETLLEASAIVQKHKRALIDLNAAREFLKDIAYGKNEEGCYAWCQDCEISDDCEGWFILPSDCVNFGFEAVVRMARDMLKRIDGHDWETTA